jgi:hypothetical protein
MEHEPSVEDSPDAENCQCCLRALPQPFSQPKNHWREGVAGKEIDEAAAEFVDHQPSCMDRQSLKSCGNNQDQPNIHALQKAGEHKKHRQEVYEPQSAEGLDKGNKIGRDGSAQPTFRNDAGGLKQELDRQPKNVEIGKMCDLGSA